MALIVKESEQKYEPAPPGLHRAVCVDVEDMGTILTPFKNKDGSDKYQHKVCVVWQTEMKNKEGQRYEVRAWYTATLGEDSNLRKALESWRGRPFSSAELGGFDLETVIGANCQINVTHKKTENKRTRAILTAIVPADKSRPKLVPEGYKRAEKKPVQAEAPVYDVDPIDEGQCFDNGDDRTVPF
jgi:hypothetical protein